MRSPLPVLACLAGLALASPRPAAGFAPAPPPASWVYMLQARDGRGCDEYAAEVAATPTDLAVIDSSCGDPLRPFTPAQMERLRRRPDGGRRLVIAYMSIGEAEDYRWYWSKGFKPARSLLGVKRPGNPAWLGRENPDWEGNYLVRYWDPAWQRILVDGPLTGPGGSPVPSYLDRIVDAGFDGVYLDIVDAYESWQDERPSAAEDMVTLVERIRARAAARWRAPEGETYVHPGFMVIPQNATELLVDPALGARYRQAISGVGVEETWYLAHDDPRDPAESARLVARLDAARAEGLQVFTVDYCKQGAKAEDAILRARARGFVPYVSHSALDRVIEPPASVGWTGGPPAPPPPVAEVPLPTPVPGKPSHQPLPGSEPSKPSVAAVVATRSTAMGAMVGGAVGLFLGPLGAVVGGATGAVLGRGLGKAFERGKPSAQPADPRPEPAPPVVSGPGDTVTTAREYFAASERLRRTLESGTLDERSRAWVEYRAAWGSYRKSLDAATP